MHALLGLSSLLVVVLGGYLALGLLRRVADWPQRRSLQFAVLASPVASLGLGLLASHHFSGRVCFLGAPPWDYTLGVALPAAMGGLALGGLGLGLLRLALMPIMARGAVPAQPWLQALADGLADRLGVPRPRVLLRAHDGPLALTWGLWRPALLLSAWMAERLDRRELESVLAHELAHVARRDYPAVWLATVLRDAFFYLPTSWAAYRQLQREKELACDDLAVAVTRRPLALASALAKVWQQAAGPAPAIAQPLAGPDDSLEGRIQRLLAAPEPPPSRTPSLAPVLGMGASALGALLVLEAAQVVALFATMGCGGLLRALLL